MIFSPIDQVIFWRTSFFQQAAKFKRKPMLYCPNCAATLDPSEVQVRMSCWNCDADFSETSQLRPVPEQPRWHQDLSRRNLAPREESPHSRYAELHPVLVTFSRFIVGGLIWVFIAALGLLSAVPYGGKDPLLYFIFVVATFTLPVWILLPVVRHFSRHKPESQKPPD